MKLLDFPNSVLRFFELHPLSCDVSVSDYTVRGSVGRDSNPNNFLTF